MSAKSHEVIYEALLTSVQQCSLHTGPLHALSSMCARTHIYVSIHTPSPLLSCSTCLGYAFPPGPPTQSLLGHLIHITSSGKLSGMTCSSSGPLLLCICAALVHLSSWTSFIHAFIQRVSTEHQWGAKPCVRAGYTQLIKAPFLRVKELRV